MGNDIPPEIYNFCAGSGALPSTLLVMPDYQNITDIGGNTYFSVSNTGGGDMHWTAQVDPASPWLHITSGSSGINNDNILVNCEANTGLPRTGYILITADSATLNSPDTVEIRQDMPVDLLLQDVQVEVNQTEFYKARNSITTSGDDTYFVVEGDGEIGGEVALDAGNEINIYPGFEVKTGSDFAAEIDPALNEQDNLSSAGNNKFMSLSTDPAVSGILRLSLNIKEDDRAFVKIFDINQRLVYENKDARAENSIDLSNRHKGLYTVKAWWRDQVFTGRISVK